jgi:hypothetical protein
MSSPRPIQPYQFWANLIWWDGPLNLQVKSSFKKKISPEISCWEKGRGECSWNRKLFFSKSRDTRKPRSDICLCVLVGQLDTAADESAAKPFRHDFPLRAQRPLHRVAEHMNKFGQLLRSFYTGDWTSLGGDKIWDYFFISFLLFIKNYLYILNNTTKSRVKL